MRSCIWSGMAENLRTVKHDPSRARGGMMAFTRDPSGNRASAIGEDSSIRRPTLETILSMILNK